VLHREATRTLADDRGDPSLQRSLRAIVDGHRRIEDAGFRAAGELR
jgi:hypothetical protein